MAAHKIFNDPVYGFVTIPRGIIMDLVEHPWFQRLRRIRQLGMTDFVYPGALHTRFQHALGSLHLMQSTIDVLRSKDVEITAEEAEAVQIAILLHDIGHGPFSHVLEHTLLPYHHEELSQAIMAELNEQFQGRLDLALSIFADTYTKPFLHQLVSGQLDMDRMDYLNRDSFFTGVHEGVIGYDRIVKMLSVVDGQLVVEEKGVYSIEKFLIARRLMYWQVYLHKTVLAAEQMLILVLERLARLHREGSRVVTSRTLKAILDFPTDRSLPVSSILHEFVRLDDTDIVHELKEMRHSPDFLLQFLANALLDRKLFKVYLDRLPPSEEFIQEVRAAAETKFGGLTPEWESFIITGKEESKAYLEGNDEILILKKSGKLIRYSDETDSPIRERITEKHFLIYPRS
ncbi:MAG: HD domain-containing protein [Saprospiraceae bacterium]|nr:HD domain-containing protein [Saprospiraceae bacterium]